MEPTSAVLLAAFFKLKLQFSDLHREFCKDLPSFFQGRVTEKEMAP